MRLVSDGGISDVRIQLVSCALCPRSVKVGNRLSHLRCHDGMCSWHAFKGCYMGIVRL